MASPSPVASRPDVNPLLLLADSDADTRRMYSTYLKEAIGDVEEAEDGREALVKALTRPPDVVVAETRLPGIDGYELCRLLRQDEATRHVPVLFVTSAAYARDLERGKRAGANATLIKPCLPTEVADEVRQLLRASADLRAHARALSVRVQAQLAKSQELVSGVRATRHPLSRAMERYATNEPPLAPPALLCSSCGAPLRYLKSHVGGVSERHREQWDYFECPTGCATYQYRPRPRKLRKV